MIDYLNTHSSEEQQRQEYYGMLLNELLCDEVVDNAQLCRQTLLPAINAYAASMGLDDTDIWADVFERYLGAKTDCHHPLVFADILRICRSDFCAALGQNVSLPLDEEFDLSKLFHKWGELFERYLANGSSYLLMMNADARNDIAKYLLSAADGSGSIRVVFPYPGTGIEPLLLLYTMSLIHEVRYGSPLDNVKFILIGDNGGLLRSIDTADNSFDEVFINLKNSFCEQNRLKVKDIKTNLKAIKHKIAIIAAEEWIDKPQSVDIAVINAAYMGCCEIGSDCSLRVPIGLLIYESRNDSIPTNYESVQVIAETFDRAAECAVHYILCQRQNNAQSVGASDTKRASAKSNYIEELYAVRDTFSEKEMKKKLAQSDYIVSEDQMIQYAELLLQAGQYAKSFNVIKQYYETDCHTLTATACDALTFSESQENTSITRYSDLP
ncbi:MAG: hypothetical protein IKN25_05830 [Spirochaetales bacterium]|nr:hypothetical protein [Spirochaetales bacterium]